MFATEPAEVAGPAPLLEADTTSRDTPRVEVELSGTMRGTGHANEHVNTPGRQLNMGHENAPLTHVVLQWKLPRVQLASAHTTEPPPLGHR